ncbi:DUF2786 domain-containing protein [Streptomyces sp. MI02-2A]|uniref:DUF2786 domain-containing protein n=1 Tax=Streptomyces sp. MI02-2A TaxID=3028688 RepID=UPI0029BF7B42|nr:DUF2786 domain-containing protein [Streptomyces sp. MI02-2A]MDX3260759.1 DUF2786 domain-containing protein [Streptomyces sp. MI02-2A]
MSDRMLDKLSKLLRQAESAKNPAEAEAFMQKAQSLASTHSIELAIARQHTAKKEQREQPTHKVIAIGEKKKLGNAHFIDLFRWVAYNNDVTLNIGNDNTYVIAFGMPSDIEVVEVLYASLVFQMVESANAWLKTGEYKSEKVWRSVRKRDRWGGSWVEEQYVTITPQAARKNFYEGFGARVYQRLSAARLEAVMAAEAREVEIRGERGSEESSSTALVLKAKADEVKEYHAKHSTAKGTWKGSSVSVRSHAARSAGDDAGRTARLGTAKAIGGSRTSIAA